MPPGFRFAVKLPREITHARRLAEASEPLARFLGEVEALGPTLGPLLVQLPPSLGYDGAVVDRFFAMLRARFGGLTVCEPRHPSWFTDAVETRLSAFQVARAAADPAVVPRAAEPGGWPGLSYWRLHGSPKIYYSDYPPGEIITMAQRLREASGKGRECWCIFDNTALGEATGDALDLLARLAPGPHTELKAGTARLA